MNVRRALVTACIAVGLVSAIVLLRAFQPPGVLRSDDAHSTSSPVETRAPAPPVRDPVEPDPARARSGEARSPHHVWAYSDRIGGRVVIADGSAELAGLGVTCHVPTQRDPDVPAAFAGDATAVVSGRTDADGAFTLVEPPACPPGTLCRAVVGRRDELPLFDGWVPLVDDMEIVVPPALVLHGRVSGLERVCGESPVLFSLAHQSRGAGMRQLGNGSFGEDGSFSVTTRLADPTRPVALQAGCGALVYGFRTSVDVLTSPTGFVATVELRELVVRVVDERARPIEQARVAVAPPGGAVDGAQCTGFTDGDGSVRFHLQRDGAMLVMAQSEGRRPSTALVPAADEAADVHLELASYGENDLVRGRVLDAQRRPVAGAIVTAKPDVDSELLRVLASERTTSAADGSFSLRAPVLGEEVVLRGFSRRGGESEARRVAPPTRDVELVLPGCQMLVLHGVAPSRSSSSGEIEWALAPVGTGVAQSGIGTLPMTTEPVGRGRYVVWLLSRDAELFARQPIEVRCDAPRSDVVLTLETPAWFTGTVQAPSARAARVVHRHPEWSDRLTEVWGTEPVAPDGSFRVFAGDREHGEIEVLNAEGEVSWRGTLPANRHRVILIER